MKYPNGNRLENQVLTFPSGNKVKTNSNGFVRVKNGGIFLNDPRYRHAGNVRESDLHESVVALHSNNSPIVGQESDVVLSFSEADESELHCPPHQS